MSDTPQSKYRKYRRVLGLLPRRILGLLAGACLLLAVSGSPALAQSEIAQEARDAFAQALELHRAKDIAGAVDQFMRAYAADSRILTLNDEGLLNNALISLQNSLESYPDDLTLNFKLAEINNIKGYGEDSLKHYEKVLSVAPGSPQAAIAREEIRKIEAVLAAERASQSGSSGSGGYWGSGQVNYGGGYGGSSSGGGSGGYGGSSSGGGSGYGGSSSGGNSGGDGYGGGQVTHGSDSNADDGPTPEEARIESLQNQLDAERQKAEELQEKLSKLQKEYAELNKKTEKYYFYYTRFFANPENVKSLGAGQ